MNAPHLMVGSLPDAAVSLLLSSGCHVMVHPDQFARLFGHLAKAVVWATPERPQTCDTCLYREEDCHEEARGGGPRRDMPALRAAREG